MVDHHLGESPGSIQGCDGNRQCGVLPLAVTSLLPWQCTTNSGGAPGSLQLNSLDKKDIPFVGRGHTPADHVRFLQHIPTVSPHQIPPGEGGSPPGEPDEERRYFPKRMQQNKTPPTRLSPWESWHGAAVTERGSTPPCLSLWERCPVRTLGGEGLAVSQQPSPSLSVTALPDGEPGAWTKKKLPPRGNWQKSLIFD